MTEKDNPPSKLLRVAPHQRKFYTYIILARQEDFPDTAKKITLTLIRRNPEKQK